MQSTPPPKNGILDLKTPSQTKTDTKTASPIIVQNSIVIPSAQEKLTGLLYSAFETGDEKKITQLKEDKGPDGKRYRLLIEKLKNIASIKDRESINRALIAFLKDIFLEALDAEGIKVSAIRMELCVSGSLAKGFATPFSDIDCFLIFAGDVLPEIKNQIQLITNRLFTLCDGLFKVTNQACLDPIGISIHRMNGLIEEIFKQVREREPDECDALTTSICTAKSVTGNNTLLIALQKKLDETFSYQEYLKQAIETFNGPRHDSKTNTVKINLKRDVIRPLDFILQGFRKKSAVPIDEFSNHQMLLKKLVGVNAITNEVAQLILYIQTKCYELRLKLHRSAKKESDEVTFNDKCPLGSAEKSLVKELVDYVGLLRGSLKSYLAREQHYQIFDLQYLKFISGEVTTDALIDGKESDESANRIAKLKVLQTKFSNTMGNLTHDTKNISPPTFYLSSVKDIKSDIPHTLPSSAIKPSQSDFISSLENAFKNIYLPGNDTKAQTAYIQQMAKASASKTKDSKNPLHNLPFQSEVIQRISNELNRIDKKENLDPGNFSRIFNLYHTLELPAIPIQREVSLCQELLKTLDQCTKDAKISEGFLQKSDKNEDDSPYPKIIETAIHAWLNKVIFTDVFPHLFLPDGKIHPQLVKVLQFDLLLKDSLNAAQHIQELSYALLSSFIVNILATMKTFLQIQNDYQCRLLFSQALNSFIHPRNKKSLLDKLYKQFKNELCLNQLSTRLESWYKNPLVPTSKLQDWMNIIKNPTKHPDFVNDLQKFLCKYSSDKDVIIFFECKELHTLVSQQIETITAKLKLNLTAKKRLNLENKFWQLNRAQRDLNDFIHGKISFDLLQNSIAAYTCYAAKFEHTSMVQILSSPKRPLTNTAEFFIDLNNRLIEMKQFISGEVICIKGPSLV